MSVPCLVKRTVSRCFSAGSGLFRPVFCSSCKHTVTRNMSSRRQTDHLQRTSSVHRQMELFPARVSDIMNESDTVKRLRLEVPHPDFSFRAGQWVDFFIPGVDTVGGFSICSSPGLLQREGVIELAVKHTRHPPAHWIHTKCSVDSQVAVRVGGNFFFDPQPSDPVVDLLLIAGGVGINPLYSILLHAADLLRQTHGQRYTPGRTHLCYSAKNTKELLFKNTIIDICHERPDKFSCDFHVTQQSSDIEQELQPYIINGRISEEELQRYVDPEHTLCYLCGPPPMIEKVSSDLKKVGLLEDKILFEKWW
ncbi:oxidoreductase NAD-binding domain-containing protein 1 [Carassius auratus]|uniref:Oxidoreductase NAD-binding domain-containing protein 1 n=1 Tax=Carassius auratus TaxID=7957 RepID=A0A6P6RJZ2_CARAU|nr:oxidoreductase NAD-binding domain-containing protein 1 [Carassius auratus]XP_026145738.1 oxidoreductase NAD-binding domain-containing protein 1 [Carassius auratus]XP_052441250.1 oxidoreductase NAD-binding domain-containing protein 1 [Carassius gibelio]XP_052441251.1 oxidoreductase NAD-binding domain-containing protein 1 [Carassius gibelio]XP_052441252.1 oxidoreductase NAD-binding domain-containing protein 1 [Carassius gibelio]